MKQETDISYILFAMSDSERKGRWTSEIQNNNNNNNNKSPFLFENDFSFYSTDTEKLVRDGESASKSFYTSAFPSWSPITNNFDMSLGNSTLKIKDEEDRQQEKPSYSDVVAKSPILLNKQKNRTPPVAINEPRKRVSRHGSDITRTGEREKSIQSHKWFSMDDLEKDGRNLINKSEARIDKTKVRGHSSPGLLDDNVKTKTVEEEVVESKGTGKGCKKSGDIETKCRISSGSSASQVRSWQTSSILSEGRSKKNFHRRSVDRGSKEVSKKGIRKKKTSDAGFYFDYVFLVVASHLAVCADWISLFARWLFELVVDVSIMSGNLSWHLFQVSYLRLSVFFTKLSNWFMVKWNDVMQRFSFSSRFAQKKKKQDDNIPLPATREEAMNRLLSCKDKDPYSILGVSPNATEEDIKKYYKKQAVLVHPDKNRIPGAEEAFKVLAHAFDIIGEPNKRKDYDNKRQEAQQMEETWNEFADLLNQLQEKMEEVANTIKCTNCKRRHRRVKIDRPRYSARFCRVCKIMHSARDGDIWAESRVLGFLWHYYACMDGAVYDVTEWAACQAKNLKHLRANTHTVQYRIISSSKHNSSSFETSPRTLVLLAVELELIKLQLSYKSEPNFEDMLKNFHKKTSNMNVKTDFSSKKKKNKKK